MDDIDRASEREQELTREALSKRMPEGPKPTGYCLQCGEALFVAVSLPPPNELGAISDMARRWCDSQCRDDWEKENG